MIRLALLPAAAALLLMGLCVRADNPKAEPVDLSGTYKILSGENEGKAEPEGRLKSDIVRFTKDKVTVTDRDKKETYVATYKLDASKKPWTISMTSTNGQSKGEIAKGLIEKDGETLRLIYALPAGETPTTFKTKEKQLMFVMKKMGS
jgi:uncharacterized protein (TIGR03067 family)